MSTRSVTSGDTSSARAAIEVVDLKHTYDGKNYALKGVTFSVGRGEVFGLLGKNGAGKSTLIKVLTTLIRPTSGSLSILGMDPVHQGKEIRSKIGVVQQAESFDFTSVEGNFDIYGILWGVPREERVKRKNELISKFGLETVRKRRSFDLSGGQKRRVQVAREMMHDMEILFLDEPTVGLDVIMRRELLESIRAEVRRGLTVVFTTHNLDEADYLCDRVAVIDLGKIIAMDTVEDLKRLYGGKKTVEVTVGGGDYQGFYEGLKARLAGMDIKVDGKSGIVLADNPKEVLQVVLELSQKSGVQLDWLNIRKNTLEDVFIDSISRGEVDQ
ncbi:MAG TPA: ABC transporter ATP-binding protein [Nitrososphaerales archaeon]|nr:ABC transporter ATP-binding protein [Nitrososphaerales archaeon]